jgi:hydrogenase nickel incorporation protein HypA/HybF
MHELAITQEIVDIATTRARDARVSRVVVEIGRLTAVLPGAVQFCFAACTEGTVAEGATLEIVEVPGRGRCTACGAEQVLEQAYAICPCGSSGFEWLSGEELTVRTIELS